MPGPLPKDPALRQRRNKTATRAILPADTNPIAAQPRLPACPNEGSWHAMAKRWWKDVWASPMSAQFVSGDVPALFRLAALVDNFWKTGSLAVAKEIRLLEREFGLTPMSRRRLQWQMATAEEAVERLGMRRMSQARDVTPVDPRGVLER